MRSLFRYVARWPRLQLVTTYMVCVALSTFLYGAGIVAHTWLRPVGAVLGLLAFSVLFAVVTWYRMEEVPGAAFLLALSSTFGFVVGFEIALTFVASNAGVAALMGAGIIFGLPIRILVSALVFGALVATGRHFRRVFAPDTLQDAMVGSGHGAA